MKIFLITCLLGFFALSGNLHASEGTMREAERRAQSAEQQQFEEWQAETRELREMQRRMRAVEAHTREGREQTEIWAQRVAYISGRLELTREEFEKFWTLYITYRNQREMLISETRRKTRVRQASGERPVFDISNLSDDEVQRLVDNQARQIDLERQFHNDLTQLLSPQRVLVFYDAERSFHRELLNARSRGRQEGRNQEEQRRRRSR
ncbi:MAG: hypothetical protein FWC94_02270 [Bacteroidales bacterium]|nr:hypothetical protein [Bacteroidales bacterium]